MKNDTLFKFPMTKAQRIFGLIMIPVHAVGLSIAVPLLCGLFFGDTIDNTYINLIYYSISFLAILIGMFGFLKKSFSDIFDAPLRFLKYIVLGYIMQYILSYIVAVIILLLDKGLVNPNSAMVMEDTVLNSNVMIVVGVLFAPIVEESMFRGALFGTIRGKNRVMAYVVSALLFSIYHLWQFFIVDGFSWTLVIYLLQYIPASLALAWCYEKSGTIWSPIVMHAAINYISLQVSVNLNM